MPATRTPPIDPLVRSYLTRKRRWSDHAVANATSILNRWTRWLTDHGRDVTTATGDDCATFLAERSTTICGATLHKDWQNLCWLYEWLTREGELPDVTRRGQLVEQTGRGPMNGIDAPTISDPDPGRIGFVSDADYRRLIAGFDRRRTLDCRNAAICSLMYWSGMRMSEVARAELDRYDPAAGTLDVLGKQNKWRTVVLLEETREWVDRYLRRRAGDTATALFASTYGAAEGTTTGHMRADAIGSMLERRCAKAGIKVTGHQFRRAFTIGALRRGISETQIAHQAGWAPSSAKLMIPRYSKPDADQLNHDAFRNNDPTAVGRRRARPVPRNLRAV